MRKGLQSNVSPRVVAVVLFVLLAAIQAWWWRAFVWKPPGKGGVSSGPMSPLPPGPQMELGREDVRVETIAGAPDPGYVDGIGRDARFDAPVGIAVDTRHDPTARRSVTLIFVADSRNHRIRIISEAGEVTTLCGSREGYADGPANAAQFRFPTGVAVGPAGELYVADSGNHRIRVVRNGSVATLAGGARGFAAGRGSMARFDTPTSICLDGSSGAALWVADAGNRRVRRVTLDGTADAGRVLPQSPVWVAPGNPVLIASPDGGVWLDGGRSISGIRVGMAGIALQHPGAVARCPEGGYIAADATQGALLRVRDGSAQVLAGGFQDPGSMRGWRDFAGDVALLGRIGGLAMDSQGRILVADTDANAVRRVHVPELLKPIGGTAAGMPARRPRADGLREGGIR